MSDPVSLEPRKRLIRPQQDKMIAGVCAGIADYTGLDVTLVRIGLIAAIVLGAGALLPVYFIAGWIAKDQPREVAAESKDERQFWQGVRASPSQSARDIRGRMREIDRRLADIEIYVTTENRSLANEIEQLR